MQKSNKSHRHNVVVSALAIFRQWKYWHSFNVHALAPVSVYDVRKLLLLFSLLAKKAIKLNWPQPGHKHTKAHDFYGIRKASFTSVFRMWNCELKNTTTCIRLRQYDMPVKHIGWSQALLDFCVHVYYLIFSLPHILMSRVYSFLQISLRLTYKVSSPHWAASWYRIRLLCRSRSNFSSVSDDKVETCTHFNFSHSRAYVARARSSLSICPCTT